jgi:hypothetical protein
VIVVFGTDCDARLSQATPGTSMIIRSNIPPGSVHHASRLASRCVLSYIRIRSAVHPGVAVPKGKLNLPHLFSTDTYPVPSRKPATTDNPNGSAHFTHLRG